MVRPMDGPVWVWEDLPQVVVVLPEVFSMKYRKPVNKGSSARKFRSDSSRTKSLNMRGAPMRGGIRL